jgi:hypothetical protein
MRQTNNSLKSKADEMQSGFTAHISSSEWRWVTLVAIAFVLLAFAPYGLLLAARVPSDEWQFMGFLHNSRDAATYLSKMMLGVQGDWMVHFQHTPEPHDGAYMPILYPVLGQIAGFLGVPALMIFHVARVLAALLMYLALYQLAATIWMRIRTRRIFFVLVSLGGGFGWLYAILSGGRVDAPDLSMPEVFPFQSTLVNVHFPLAIAAICLLISLITNAFRPGSDNEPRMNNGGLVAVVASLGLALLYPQALVPLGGALVLYTAWRALQRRTLNMREIYWVLLILLPALPMAVYYGAVVLYNPAMAEWSRQNVTLAPPVLVMAIGLGLPLVVAIPGIYRAVRHSEAHDDRFMLVWLVVILVALYLPTNIQRRFAVGMMIPLAYFGTRALESFWLPWFSSRRWRYRALVIGMFFAAFTHIFVLFVPTLPILLNQPQNTQGLFLKRDYALAFDWIDQHTTWTDVVLASELVSLWLPGWTKVRVVYGHPYETLQAEIKKEQVRAWYESGEGCQALLQQYGVRYIVYGPEEAAMGNTDCLSGLQEVFRSGEVSVYAP